MLFHKYMGKGEVVKEKENSMGWQITTVQILPNNLSLKNLNIFSVTLKLLGYL